MQKLFVTGGRPLKGRVTIEGAKNAASKMIIASLLTADDVKLSNIPLQEESDIAKELVEMVGAKATLQDHTMTIRAAQIGATSTLAQTRKNRLSILLAAPLLHRKGEAVITRVEGDKIGPRPVNFHLDALEKMGAKVEVREDGWYFKSEGRLRGVSIELPYPSVGATETILFAGVLAKGNTAIRNAAIEPEIMELIAMLQKMGANIELDAGRTIYIQGVEELHGCEHRVLPDRLVAASYACIALATGGEIFCERASQRDMITFLNAVRTIGGDYEVHEDGILFAGSGNYKATTIETDTFPGFSTDWQQPFVVVLTQAQGKSVVHETVMRERFGYTEVLNQMGANIHIEYLPDEIAGPFKHQNYNQSAVIEGPTPLHGINMTVPDIRAGLAYVAAALAAEGTSEIDGLHHLERGYEDLYGKLQSIGADIKLQ